MLLIVPNAPYLRAIRDRHEWREVKADLGSVRLGNRQMSCMTLANPHRFERPGGSAAPYRSIRVSRVFFFEGVWTESCAPERG
jgi:hypothetical protein